MALDSLSLPVQESQSVFIRCLTTSAPAPSPKPLAIICFLPLEMRGGRSLRHWQALSLQESSACLKPSAHPPRIPSLSSLPSLTHSIPALSVPGSLLFPSSLSTRDQFPKHQTRLQEHQGCGPLPGPASAADRGGESSKACVDQCRHPEGSQCGHLNRDQCHTVSVCLSAPAVSSLFPSTSGTAGAQGTCAEFASSHTISSDLSLHTSCSLCLECPSTTSW